jgi:O-antigen ligase
MFRAIGWSAWPGRSAWRFQAAQALVAAAVAVLIAWLPLPLAVAIVLSGAAAALALHDPAFAVAAAILSVPVQDLVQIPGGLSVTQVCLLLGLASLALRTLLYPERPLPLGPLFWPLAIFVWWLGVSAAFTPFSLSEGLRETLRWSTVLLIYLLTLAALEPRTKNQEPGAFSLQPSARSDWRLLLILACLLIAPASNALLGIWQFVVGAGPESFAIAGGRARAFGTIGQPNSFAGYMNQVWPLAAGLSIFALFTLLQRLSCSIRAGVASPARAWVLPLLVLGVAGGVAALTVGALLASFSRGGWVGALAGGLVLTLATLPALEQPLRRVVRRLLVAGLLGVVLVLALGGGGLLPAPLAQRLSSITANLRLFDVRGVMVTPENFAVVERMAHLQAGWNMLRARPLLGVGPGNYSIAFEQPPAVNTVRFTTRPWYESRGHAHNYYIHIAAETGLVGVLAYLGLIGAVALQAWRSVRRARSWLWRGVAVGGAGVVAAVAVHNIFENLHVLNMGLQLGTIWALMTVIAQDGSWSGQW